VRVRVLRGCGGEYGGGAGAVTGGAGAEAGVKLRARCAGARTGARKRPGVRKLVLDSAGAGLRAAAGARSSLAHCVGTWMRGRGHGRGRGDAGAGAVSAGGAGASAGTLLVRVQVPRDAGFATPAGRQACRRATGRSAPAGLGRRRERGRTGKVGRQGVLRPAGRRHRAGGTWEEVTVGLPGRGGACVAAAGERVARADRGAPGAARGRNGVRRAGRRAARRVYRRTIDGRRRQ
jgi:hypothetical protein